MGASDDDLSVEANWYDEFGGALESVAAEYRRAAGLLRLAGEAMRPADLVDFRQQLADLTRRVIAAAAVGAVFLEQQGGGLK